MSTTDTASMTAALRGVDAEFLDPVGDVGPVVEAPGGADLAVSPVVAELTGRPPHTFRAGATRHRAQLG